jgi:arylsulfatase A-like enzyme
LLEARIAGELGLWGACVGLAAPLALLVGAAVWAFRVVFLAGASWSPLGFGRWLTARQGSERSVWLVAPPLFALVTPFAVLALSGVATRVLGAEGSSRSAMGLMWTTVLPLVLAAIAGVRVLSLELSPRFDAARRSTTLAFVASVALVLLLVGLLVAFGETGGGGGPWKILGVLRRQELDLRAPGLLLLIALGALLVPSPRQAGAAVALLGLGLAPALLTWRTAGGLDEPAALAIERSAPLSRGALGLLRRLSDRDRDGVSAAFAGGDCNDRDAAINPRAVDVPGNGKDEDCQDGDASSAPLVAKPSGGAIVSARQRLPADLNVLLLTIDTLRADLGYMGNPRPLSPRLDALASQSVVFERAYSLASYTGKSVGPLLIGKYSSEIEGGFSHFNRYPKSETLVQERLHAAGVRTLSVQGYWYFFKDAGFERGFDVVDSRAAPKVASIEGDQTSNSDEQSDAVIELLGAPELTSRRFFMWAHYVDPHAEYAAHPEHDFGSKPRDRYDGEVAFVDHHVGRVLDALARAPFAERTVVIVTSDHGEAFGEHGMIRHGFELWEELVRVPLLVKLPGVTPRRVSARRSAIDLVPTLLDLFQVPFVGQGPRDFLSGQSLLPDLVRPAGEPDPERPIFIDMARGPYNAERQALITGDLKLTVSEGRVLGLYDLASDPAEKNDLSRDKARVAPARRQLSAFKSQLRRVPMPAQ